MKAKKFRCWLIYPNGECYSLTLKRMMKPQHTGKPGSRYRTLSYKKDGRQLKLKVSRIVATLFIPNPENKREVNHKDGNKVNDHYKNLEWVTPSENILHAIETGLNPKIGELNHNAKIFNKDVAIIKEMYANGFPQKAIGALYKIDQSSISRIVNNTIYNKIHMKCS